MEEKKKKTRWNEAKVLELFENNVIKNVTDFQKMFPGACVYAYRNNLIDYLPFKNRGTSKTKTKKITYDVTKVLHYLVRWANEENTSVQYQATKYGYGTEYKEYIQKNR